MRRGLMELMLGFLARLPSVDLAHGDLSRGEQRPEQHGGFGEGSTV